MKLYKEEGVNPIGCLGPMLIQVHTLTGAREAERVYGVNRGRLT